MGLLKRANASSLVNIATFMYTSNNYLLYLSTIDTCLQTNPHYRSNNVNSSTLLQQVPVHIMCTKTIFHHIQSSTPPVIAWYDPHNIM